MTFEEDEKYLQKILEEFATLLNELSENSLKLIKYIDEFQFDDACKCRALEHLFVPIDTRYTFLKEKLKEIKENV